jgi:hypothetical protein
MPAKAGIQAESGAGWKGRGKLNGVRERFHRALANGLHESCGAESKDALVLPDSTDAFGGFAFSARQCHF